MPQSSTSDQFDVAVVGGGVSGLYTAWRLLRAAREEGKPRRVTVFEASDRIGGRLLTWLPKGIDGGLRAELGGMRFLEQQKLVWELLSELGFSEKKDFLPFYVSGENLRLLLRGEGGPLDGLEPGRRYLLPESNRGKSARQIIEEVIEKVVLAPENKKCHGGKLPVKRKEWDDAKPCLTWKGRHLWDLGFWDLLSEILTAETYQYITDAFGYYSLASNWNAAEAIEFISLDFTTKPAPEKPEYLTLRQGYEALPQALGKKVESLGGEIVTETRLISFEAPKGGRVSATFLGPKARFSVDAQSLVLGLPRRSIELLAPTPDFDLQSNDKLRRLIETVAPVPAFKFFLFFEERWWEKLGIDRGRSVCDLPIRQTYYLAPDSHYETKGRKRGRKPVPPWGLVMASYGDARAVDYWQGMVPPQRKWKEGRAELRAEIAALARRVGLKGGVRDVADLPPELNRATPQMIKHAREQLALLHDIPLSQIPEKCVGAFADWSLDPYGGGWNFWKPQVDVHEAMTKVKAPLGKDHPVYIVGESYSGGQGWVEGALSTAELVLQRYFGLRRPAWLPRGYYLGW